MVENFRELDWNDTFHYFDYHHIGAMFIRRRFPLTLWLWRINFEFYEGPAQPWPTPVHWKAAPPPPPQPPPPYLQPWWKPGPSMPVPRPNFSCIGKAEGFYYRGPCVPEFYVCFGWVHAFWNNCKSFNLSLTEKIDRSWICPSTTLPGRNW